MYVSKKLLKKIGKAAAWGLFTFSGTTMMYVGFILAKDSVDNMIKSLEE